MVGTERISRFLVASLLLALALLLVFATAGACRAAESDEPTITEEYTVTVNPVGDGHIVDTITYSYDDFEAVKKVEDKNRGFLTRRYKTDDNRGEVVDFDVQLNASDNSVVITYDKPGFAYFTEGEWAVYGMAAKPKKQSGRSFTFEEKSTTNSEFTLFTDQVILTTTTIELPAAASDYRHDEDESAIKYGMPAAQSLMGFWSEKRVLMSMVFGLCAVVFAGLLILVLTRGTGRAAAAVVPPESPPAPSSPARFAAGFCGRCGKHVGEGKKFCPHCGAPR